MNNNYCPHCGGSVGWSALLQCYVCGSCTYSVEGKPPTIDLDISEIKFKMSMIFCDD